MATSALKIITGAMRDLGLLGSGESPTGAEAVDALDALNGLLDQWDLDETLKLYLTPPESEEDEEAPGYRFEDLTTEVDLPAGYEKALRYSLAYELSSEYGVSVSQTLYKKMHDSQTVISRHRAPDVPYRYDPIIDSFGDSTQGYDFDFTEV